MNVRACRRSMLLVIGFLLAPSLAAAQPACQPGRFASAQSGTCDACNPGTYQPAIGQDGCFDCEAGRFTDVPARTACDQCGPGRFQDMPGRTTCFECTAGNFRDATGQTSCASCAPGRFVHSSGASSCDSCVAGTFSDVTGATTCDSCTPGKYASDGAATCASCDPGRYADAGATTCKSCQPGKYSGVVGATTCGACAPGKFSGVTVDALGDPHYASTCTTPNAYSCHKAKDLKMPKFTVEPTPVTDVYTLTVDAKVKSPALVCAPVDLGSGVEDASARQCCYKVAAPGLPKPHPHVVTSGGKFTGSELEVLQTQLICEPCGADLVP